MNEKISLECKKLDLQEKIRNLKSKYEEEKEVLENELSETIKKLYI